MPFIAGAFTATHDADVLGDVENGFTIEYTPLKQLIRGDAYGEMVQDAVYQGIDCFLEFELLVTPTAEADLELMTWPWTATADVGDSGTIGSLDSAIVKQIVLTAADNTPAKTTSGHDTVYTFPRCTLAEGFPNRLLLSSKLRTYPLRFRVYPNSSGEFFVKSAPYTP